METLAGLKPRHLLICGASGRLGSALKRLAERKGFPVAVIDTQLLRAWLDDQDSSVISRFLGEADETDIVFAGGLTDPATPSADLISANVELPNSFHRTHGAAHRMSVSFCWLGIGNIRDACEK